MIAQAHASLRPYNTFGVEARARQLLRVGSADEVAEVVRSPGLPLFVLGGGSNLLLTRDLECRVLRVEIGGRAIVEDGDAPLVAAGAGENWHELVLWTLDQGLAGLENLALIPGTVGAAPIQNIGAYGVEQSACFERLEAIDRADGSLHVLEREACRFGYRTSCFKAERRDRMVITRVYYRLRRSLESEHLGYEALRRELAGRGLERPTPREVAEAVIRIRRAKLPDPRELGNAGSFFQNPVLETARADALQAEHPDLLRFPAGPGRVKVPAGWLIERCGWKGRRLGDAGCYHRQALVLVNHGRATGAQIRDLARRIAGDVEATFGIRLQPEVNIL